MLAIKYGFFRNRLEIKDILYVCSWSNFVCNALLFAKKETERQFIFFCQLVIKERYTELYCQVWHLSRGENWICIFCLPPWYNVNYQNICKVLLRLKGLISPYKKWKRAWKKNLKYLESPSFFEDNAILSLKNCSQSFGRTFTWLYQLHRNRNNTQNNKRKNSLNIVLEISTYMYKGCDYKIYGL